MPVTAITTGSGKAEQAAGILKARHVSDGWVFYCPIHQSAQFADPAGYPYNPQDKPDGYLKRDGDNGFPLYKCGSRGCDDERNADFLSMLRDKLGNELVWTPDTRRRTALDEDSAVQVPLPSERELTRWAGYLTDDNSEQWKDGRQPYLDYLTRELGLSHEQIRCSGLGVRGFYADPSSGLNWGVRMTLPIRNQAGELVGVRLWNPFLQGHSRKFQRIWWPGHGSAHLMGVDRLPAEPGVVVLTEGESDYFAALGASIPALCHTGGALTPPQHCAVLAGWKVVVAYDNDETGRKGAHTTARALLDGGATPYIFNIAQLAALDKADLRDALKLRDAAEVREALLDAANGAPWTPADEKSANFEQKIGEEAERIRIRDAARRLVAADGWTPPDDKGTLADQLLEPDVKLAWHFENLAFHGANIAVIAEAKAGKTVLVLNVIRALVDDAPLFGYFPVKDSLGAGRKVAWWNAELVEAQAKEWLRSLGIENPDRVVPLHMRGAHMPFEVQDVEDWTVAWLKKYEVAVWIIDPKSALFDGEENSATENGAWLKAIDRIKRRAGVETAFLVHHASQGVDLDEASTNEIQRLRGRGSTRLTGWQDVQWSFVGQGSAARYLSALGRDVDLQQFGGLSYNPVTRSLVWDGSSTSAKETRNIRMAREAWDQLQEGEELNTREIQSRMSGLKPEYKREALDLAVQRGWLERRNGPSNAVLHKRGSVSPNQKLSLKATAVRTSENQ